MAEVIRSANSVDADAIAGLNRAAFGGEEEVGIIERLGKANLRPLVHFPVFAISCVYSDDVRFVAHGLCVVLRSTERFCPVGSEPLRVLGVIYARERVADDGVGQAARMPCVRQGEHGGLSASDIEYCVCHVRSRESQSEVFGSEP